MLVDECSALIGQTGLYTTISTYNETNAIEVIGQYNQGFGMLTNRLYLCHYGLESVQETQGPAAIQHASAGKTQCSAKRRARDIDR